MSLVYDSVTDFGGGFTDFAPKSLWTQSDSRELVSDILRFNSRQFLLYSLVFINNLINNTLTYKKQNILFVLYCPGPNAVIYNMYKSMTYFPFVSVICIVLDIYFFIWWSPFITSRNLDEVFTYNHVWLYI